MGSRGNTRQRILDEAKALVRSGGPAALTFDAVARRLGVSKQAVLYWFPRKEDLLVSVAIPALRDEAQAALSAMVAAPDSAAAVRGFVTAVGRFHLSDLDRFRIMYIAPQQGDRRGTELPSMVSDHIHALTATMYNELERHLGGSAHATERRRQAVAIHMAVLGFVMMVSLTETMGDPLLHAHGDLLNSLASMLSRR